MVRIAVSSALKPVHRAKLELMQAGLMITPAALRYINERVGVRPLTLADYASTSGVSLKLEGDVWVNAPTAEHNPNFVFAPSHALIVADGQLAIQSESGALFATQFVPVPDYHAQETPAHRLYTEYVHTHTDRARISPIRGCAMRCTFCDIPYEFKGRYWLKPASELIEALQCAFDDPMQPAAHALISGGTPAGKDYARLQECYLQVLTAFPDRAIDIMMVPHPDILDLEALEKAGVNELSLNLEVYNQRAAAEIIPQKQAHGLEAYLAFIEQAVERLGRRKGRPRVRSMLLVGLEDEDSTLAGVEALAQRGCSPVLSPFRPDPITDLAAVTPPTADQLERIYLRAEEICARHDVPLGPGCGPCMHNTLTLPGPDTAQHTHGSPRLI
jgi:Radical SAM superfamily